MKRSVTFYEAKVEVDGKIYNAIVESVAEREQLIGREVLDQMKVAFDGPSRIMTVDSQGLQAGADLFVGIGMDDASLEVDLKKLTLNKLPSIVQTDSVYSRPALTHHVFGTAETWKYRRACNFI